MNEQALNIELGISLSNPTTSEKEFMHLLEEILEFDTEEQMAKRFSTASEEAKKHAFNYVPILLNQLFEKFPQVI